MIYDVFNGDADGILSLLQLRKAKPSETTLITGVKRDIALVKNVPLKSAKKVNVLDISLEKNIDQVNLLLAEGVDILYADHHRSGDLPDSRFFSALIDTDPNTCTALIIDQMLNGQYREWAITAAFGDNLNARASQLAEQQGLNTQQAAELKELGVLINYNGYGAAIEDLHYHPADLYKQLLQYDSPFDVISDKSSPFSYLQNAYAEDISKAKAIQPSYISDSLLVVELPNSAWSRRVSGVFGNLLANEAPNRAHAVLTTNLDQITYTLSLRAPMLNKQGAGDICAQFETGEEEALQPELTHCLKVS
ncbi:DHH family phosphoesterase [Shewanella aestuarii]|uniref:DHH family phosphoesterase n=1 Tax=Shewanella aestuarii TaxID=1028752 RepID=UPI0032999C78